MEKPDIKNLKIWHFIIAFQKTYVYKYLCRKKAMIWILDIGFRKNIPATYQENLLLSPELKIFAKNVMTKLETYILPFSRKASTFFFKNCKATL